MAHRKVSLGRMATFLIPANKDSLVHDQIRSFLIENFESFTFSDAILHGYYKKHFEGKFIRYEVCFLGKERIPMLDSFLAKLARQLEEECIIETTGEDAWLIFP